MRKTYSLIALIIIAQIPGFSQSANVSLNRDYYHLLDRFEIMSGHFSPTFHGHVKPIQRMYIAAFIDSLYADTILISTFSKRDQFNLQYLATDNWEWSENDSSDSRKPFLKAHLSQKT
jgi:hypothetical protein